MTSGGSAASACRAAVHGSAARQAAAIRRMIVMRIPLRVAVPMVDSCCRTTEYRRRTTDKGYSSSVLCRPSSVVCSSVTELFAQDALVEAVAGIEQHVHVDAVIHADLDGAHRSHLVMVGDGGDRALFG